VLKPGCGRNDCSSSWWWASGHLAASFRARPYAFRPGLGLNDLSLRLAAWAWREDADRGWGSLRHLP